MIVPPLTTAVGINRPRGSRERAPVYVQCEPKANDEVAHQQLPCGIFPVEEGPLALASEHLFTCNASPRIAMR